MVDIRLLTIDDFDALHRVWTSTGQETNGAVCIDDNREGIEKYIKRNPSTSFVAEENGEVIGVIMAGHDGRRGFFHHVSVAREHQGKGIGKQLVAHAMEALRKEGIRKVALVAFTDNDLGNGFWESQGLTVREDLYYRNKYTGID
ncbi:MAG: GNAT family N-acetyltransferase [Ruminococcus sp.]|nr:GNAT family N-acetyltransferase [Ruminococcus sp.]